MAIDNTNGHLAPSWFVAPGESDHLAWISFAFICLALFGLVTLYAAFDRWAEHQSKGTPLAKTIPTMLTVALLYEIFPLGHFNILLPLAAILIALMADWSRFNLRSEVGAEPLLAGGTATHDGSSGDFIDRSVIATDAPSISDDIEEERKDV